jgi:acyl-CoA thioester hydrolase
MSEPWRELLRGVVHPWHQDQFGHMNVRWYAHFFDDAAFHLWPEFGISLQAMERDLGVHSVTARASTSFVRELVGGDLIRIEGGVGRIGTKSVSFSLRMLHVDTGALHAECELVEVFFDPKDYS